MSSLIIALMCGLKESVNPCNLLTAFIFFYMVSLLRTHRFDVSRYSAIFLTAFFVCLFLSSLGAYVPILLIKHVFFFIKGIYLAAGIVLVLCGFLHFCDWGVIKGNDRHNQLSFPLIAGDKDVFGAQLNFKLYFFLILSVFLLSIMSSVWPQESYVAFNTNFILVPGKFLETYLMLLVYNFALVLPIVGGFILSSSPAYRQWIECFAAMVKIVLAALTLGLGVSLIYIFH